MIKRIISVFLLCTMILQVFPSLSFVSQAEAAVSVSEEDVQELFYARSFGQHPRVLANNDDFSRIRSLIQTDPYMSRWYDTVYSYCIDHLERPTAEYTLSNNKLLGVCRIAGFRIINMAFVYHISGETKFAERAVKEMLAACSFSDWNPYNCLDVAQMAYGVGLGYDWLYEYMTQEQRDTICEALYRHAIVYAQTATDFKEKTGNWNSWSYGGLIIAVTAVFESYPSECAALIAEAVENLPTHSMSILSPAGSYSEGASYHRIGIEFTVLLIEALKTTLGSDFGLSQVDGFKETGKYLLAVNGEAGCFNFGDGSNTVQFATAPMLHWFANQFQMPELSVYQRSHQITYSDMRDEYLALLWYNPELVEEYSEEDIQQDFFLPSDHNISIASFRSGSMGKADIYAAIKDGDSQSNGHADADVGTFVLDALGERWFEDLGSDDYSLPGYFTNVDGFYPEDAKRWNYYRKRAEGQNTLVINPSSLAGQKTPVDCKITHYQSAYDGGLAVVNMTDAYSDYNVSSLERALMLFDNRSRVLLRDEIVCTEASEIYWFAHTQAEIVLSEDGKTATLTKKGKTLLAQIAAPATAVFSVMAADPLSTSPASHSKEYDRSSYRKLAIHLTDVTSAEISVVFTPVTEESELNLNKSLPEGSIAEISTVLHGYEPTAELSVNESGEYEIYNAEQLMKFSEMVNNGNSFAGKTVKLMADINLKCRSFIPIGGGADSDTTYGQTFKGTFDGCNHVIKNLLIYLPSSRYVAFFGSIHSATIKNLGIDSGSVFGGSRSAGFVASAKDSTIDNCYNKADVRSSADCNAGLVAQLGGNSELRNCYSNCKVRGTSISGGIIGYIVSKANVSVTNCYHAGSLTDTKGRCGFIGFYYTSGASMPESVTVAGCYCTQALKCAEVVDNDSIERYSESFQISSAKLVSAAISLGADFIYDCEWENDGYPVLTWQCSTVLPEDSVLTTSAQLRMLAYMVNSGADDFAGKTIKLGSDINLVFREWIPIGGNSESTAAQYTFRGTFDGNGHVIRNLRITTGNFLLGLFGDVGAATIKNVGVRGGYISGTDYIGGIAGRIRRSVIQNCFSDVMTIGGRFVGGVIGISGSGNNCVENCYYTGNVSATGNAGGIVAYCSGDVSNFNMKNCYNAGVISGSAYSGGLIGGIHENANSITATNSYTANCAVLVGSSNRASLNNCAVLSDEDMKTSADVLGNSFVNDFVRSKNNGYPLLTWEGCDLSGHDYQYRNNLDDTHTRLCIRCGNSSKETHIYTDGFCACEVAQTPLAPQGVLMFDFSNDFNAKRKYADATYGGYNYDLEKYWATAYSGVGNGDSYVTIDHAVGALTLNLSKRTNGYGARLQPVGESNTFAYSTDVNYANYLNFDPTQAEIFQIRLKLEDAVHYGKYKQGVYLYYLPENAEKWSGASSPNTWAEYFKCEIDDACLAGGEKEGEYVTLTASLRNKKFSTYSAINGLWLQFNYLYGGTATIDYIYIGPAINSTPRLKTVNFLSENGERCLFETATYTTEAIYDGIIPTKEADAVNHYTFTGWVDGIGNIVNLSSVTTNITVYASFASSKHSYSYISGDAEHIAACTCGYSHTEAHIFDNGECICGAKEVLEPIYDGDLKFSHSLTLENDISINFIGQGSALSAYDTFYLECKVPVYSGNELVGYEIVNIDPVFNGTNYEFTLTGVTAKMMNNEIEAVFRLTKSGQEYYSKTDVYSVAEYAYGKLDSTKTTDTDELKAICANLLRYGAMAQTQFNYRTDALVDADMTDTHKAFLTDLATVEMKDYRKQLADHDAPTVPWKSTTLELGNKVIMCLIANLANYTGDPSELIMRLTFTDNNGAVITEERPLELYNPDTRTYAVRYDGLRATEMRSVVSAAIYNGNTRVSKTVEYSIESYGARNTDFELQELCLAMLAYGDSAKAFFAN